LPSRALPCVAPPLGNADESLPVRPLPVKSVAAEAHEQLVALRAIARGHHLVRRALPDHEQPQHQALVGHAVQVVQLRNRIDLRVRIDGIQAVRTHPEGRAVSAIPTHRGHGIGPLVIPSDAGVLAAAVENGPLGADDPDLAEGIVEGGRPVVARPGPLDLPAPADAVRRIVKHQAAPRGLAEAEHLEPPAGILRRVVQPNRVGVPIARVHDVRARLDQQGRLDPAQAVFRDGVAGAVQRAAHVPHLEALVFRVVPDPVAIGNRVRPVISFPALIRIAFGFPRPIRPENRIALVGNRPVELALQGRFLDQEVIHEQLPAHVDGNHGGGMRQVRHGHRLARIGVHLRRPAVRKDDPVIEPLSRTCPRGKDHQRPAKQGRVPDSGSIRHHQFSLAES